MASCIMFTLSVPLITPNVSIIPVIDGHRLSLNFSVNVSLVVILQNTYIHIGQYVMYRRIS